MRSENGTGSYLDAACISNEIAQALHKASCFNPIRVTVAEEEGLVRLYGHVSAERERQIAAAKAWSIRGVTDVENNIIVVEKAGEAT